MNEDLKIFTDNVDPAIMSQLHEMRKSGLFEHIRIMPDVHAGKDSVVGFTAKFKDRISPFTIGTDIGCGMYVVYLGKVDIDLPRLDAVIKNYIPSGKHVGDRSKELNKLLKQLDCYKELKHTDELQSSLGTLGGGNHFIEVDQDENGYKYLVIHTGSRNLGKQVAQVYQYLALRRKKLKELDPGTPDYLCYLEDTHMFHYLFDCQLCNQFAKMNREAIAETIIKMMKLNPEGAFDCPHNYIADSIIRKGAVAAYKGEGIIIPLNMRDGAIMGTGLSNEDWNYSAPHGAGRIMSRSEAKKNISLEDYKKSMEGIYSSSVSVSTIDESPFAYKPPQEIIDKIEPTVCIWRIIKPIYNFKSGRD